MALSNLAEMAWWAALSLTTRPLSPIVPSRVVGSSTAHLPTYVHSSSAVEPFSFSFFAWEGFHLVSQSSVNCSRKGALNVVGWWICTLVKWSNGANINQESTYSECWFLYSSYRRSHRLYSRRSWWYSILCRIFDVDTTVTTMTAMSLDSRANSSSYNDGAHLV